MQGSEAFELYSRAEKLDYEPGQAKYQADAEVASLYDKLEKVIIPLFYGRPDDFALIMQHSIAHNGSFFNTQRMLLQYLSNAYFPAEELRPSPVSSPS